jgi:hypothetical protein
VGVTTLNPMVGTCSCAASDTIQVYNCGCTTGS